MEGGPPHFGNPPGMGWNAETTVAHNRQSQAFAALAQLLKWALDAPPFKFVRHKTLAAGTMIPG